jgi:hypothetical protein
MAESQETLHNNVLQGRILRLLQSLAPHGLREARALPSNQRDHGVMLWACSFGSCSRTYLHSQPLRKHESVCHEVKHWVCNYKGCGIADDNTSSLAQQEGKRHYRWLSCYSEAVLVIGLSLSVFRIMSPTLPCSCSCFC